MFVRANKGEFVMRNLAILTSVLALAACGGGSGGMGPGAVVKPSGDEFLVSQDSGLTMVDVNAMRTSQYEQAMKTVQAIESGHDVDGGATVSRVAVAHRQGINSFAKSNEYTAEDIDAAYQIMHDILVGGSLENKTNHDVLMALALSGMQELDIIEFLKSVNNGNSNLTENIKYFMDVLAGDEKTDEIEKLISRANFVYKDFGKEFKTTLNNAEFKGTVEGLHFTFVFEDGQVKSLTQVDGNEESYATIGGGRFQQSKKGTEYWCDVPMGGGNSISGSVFFASGETPTEQEIKERLLSVLKVYIQNDQDGSTLARVREYLDDMNIITYKEECGDGNGCVVSAPVNYSDGILVESRGKELGLKYSDFGLLISSATMNPGHVDVDDTVTEIDKEITYHEHGVFFGGYADNEANAPTTDMTFSGLAYAGVTTKRNDWEGTDEYQEPKLAQYDGVATLTVTNTDGLLNQKLVADFSGDGWYTVTVDDMGTMNNNGIHFTGKSADSEFAYRTGDGDLENLEMKYYGPDVDTPTEATGVIQYVERDVNAESDSDWGYKADISFGVKRD